MQTLKYRIIPEGAADGVVPLNWVFLDKKDIDAAGITDRQACELIAKELKDTCAAVNVMDMDGVTVTSDGIMADGAVAAIASVVVSFVPAHLLPAFSPIAFRILLQTSARQASAPRPALGDSYP